MHQEIRVYFVNLGFKYPETSKVCKNFTCTFYRAPKICAGDWESGLSHIQGDIHQLCHPFIFSCDIILMPIESMLYF